MTAELQFAEQAEKFADSAARHLTEDPRDMRISEVAAGIAQAYATLAVAESQRRARGEAAASDGHESVDERARCGCADPVFHRRESRDGVLVRIGMQMPRQWGWERLEGEFMDAIGAPLEEASLPDLKRFLKRLVDQAWSQDGVTCPF